MKLFDTGANMLHQLADTINLMNPEDFVKPSHALSGATMGQHLRHTLEFFICLEEAYDNGTVNYDRRNRDVLMESDKFFALEVIARIEHFVRSQRHNKELTLEVDDEAKESACHIGTNYYRELVYNIEHAVHHMAIMKIGLREVAPYVTVPPDFGVAASTVRFRKETMATH